MKDIDRKIRTALENLINVISEEVFEGALPAPVDNAVRHAKMVLWLAQELDKQRAGGKRAGEGQEA